MKWHALGRLFPPSPGVPLPDWMGTYGALPFAVPIGSGRARVFFSGRDDRNRAHVGACTVDLDRMLVDPGSFTREPLVAPGPMGTFDESGCTMSSIVFRNDRWFLYYTGWTLGRSVPFYLAAGLAISDDGGQTFRKHSPAPLLDRSAIDPYLTASPAVLVENGLWRMWYVSAVRWEQRADGPRHYYLIKYAESDDGIHWRRDGGIAVGFESDDEYALGRPHVIHDGDGYRMWFCVRGDSYRIASASSGDGLTWVRDDDSAPPAQDWDREMQAYPMVLPHEDRWIMFYNGNGYGKSGFGCAVAEVSS